MYRWSGRATCWSCATIRATARSCTASGATSRMRSSGRVFKAPAGFFRETALCFGAKLLLNQAASELERRVRPVLPALAFVCIGLMFAPVVGQQRTAVTIALVPSVPSVSTFIAAEKGYFDAAGLDVKIERIDSLSKAMAFVATNQVQVGQGGINAGYFNGVAEGLPVVMALESGSTPLYHRILVRPELKDKIKTVADLKGRAVGISSPGSTSVYEIGMVLASAGLRIKDIDLKYLAFTQMGAALANGALDAALEAPFSDVAIEQKI